MSAAREAVSSDAGCSRVFQQHLVSRDGAQGSSLVAVVGRTSCDTPVSNLPLKTSLMAATPALRGSTLEGVQDRLHPTGLARSAGRVTGDVSGISEAVILGAALVARPSGKG